MLRKLTLIFVLAVLFGAFLIVRPYINRPDPPPTIEDRLPDAEYMATVDCIRLAREVSGMMFYYKISYRDFLSPEFILTQAKSYGLDLQKTSYFFGNSNGEFGVLANLIDSTRLNQGIEKLKYFFETKEYKIQKQKVIKLVDHNAYLFYGNDYICYYQGDDIKKQIKRICYAENSHISPNWVELINQKHYIDKCAIISSKLPDFDALNIEHALAYPLFDSTGVTFNLQLKTKDTIPFKLKEGGPDFVQGTFTKMALNLHLDPTYLKNHPEHPLYQYLLNKRTRIRLPINDFISNWGGDLSFHQGGWVNVKQNYIESELDDNFNITEVVRTKETKVPGFAMYYSLAENSQRFKDLMLRKGFVTEQEGKFHFLLSPPLNFARTKNNEEIFYAASVLPKTIRSVKSYVMWSSMRTKFTAKIDSISTFNFYGSLNFSLKNILQKEKLMDE